ncbi:hypothetical protein D3C80_2033970 [compost metagenome]
MFRREVVDQAGIRRDLTRFTHLAWGIGAGDPRSEVIVVAVVGHPGAQQQVQFVAEVESVSDEVPALPGLDIQ